RLTTGVAADNCALLDDHRRIRQLVAPRPVRRKVRRELPRDRLDPFDDATLEISRLEVSLHLGANFFPARRTDFRIDPAIGDDLDVAISEQQIDQHAVVVGGIPDPQLRKNVQRSLPRGLIPEQRRAVQRAFNNEADLAGMGGLACPDCPLDRSQHMRRENPPHPPAVLQKMSADAPDAHCLPSPRRAATAKTAATAAETAAVARAAAASGTPRIRAATKTAGPVASSSARRRGALSEQGDDESYQRQDDRCRQRTGDKPCEQSDNAAGGC